MPSRSRRNLQLGGLYNRDETRYIQGPSKEGTKEHGYKPKLTLVRASFGNRAGAVPASTVADIRGKLQNGQPPH